MPNTHTATAVQYEVRMQYRDRTGHHNFTVCVPATSATEAVSRGQEVLRFQRGATGFRATAKAW